MIKRLVDVRKHRAAKGAFRLVLIDIRGVTHEVSESTEHQKAH